ncbi:MAG: bifunctional diguanylate cyclase/phosphodiesterase [Candidatus Thiodiazotropha sp. (ex. Lucinoma kazani)]
MLTGPNRYYLEKHFANWHPRNNDRYSVIFLDMNNFKNINDNYGHTIGDKILVQLAQRLQSACADEALVVRQGGDEFIFIKPYTNNHELRAFIIFLIKSIKEKIYVDSLEFYLNGCIGVSISGRHDSALEELLRQADLAMYEAKRSHTDFTFYSEQLQQISNERSDIEEALHYAFTDNQMYMEYQPQISSECGRIVGVEALIRWAHPTMGMVSPEKFIPIAESSGLINTVGDFVIDTTFREVLEIYNLDIQQPIRISINISVRQLLTKRFRSFLNSKSRKYGIRPSNVVLEITENVFIEDLDLIQNLLQELKYDGYQISLDDFGTGYSSLSVLQKLPIDEIKVDKGFVHDILSSNQDNALILGIIGIGQNLNIPILAEGVEELEQVILLKKYGCDLFQGYYFSKSVNKDRLIDYLNNYTPFELHTHNEICSQ